MWRVKIMPKKLDLDVSNADEVSDVLRKAADTYYESAMELSSAWQSKSAGAPWIKIARILESAADKIDKTL